jgi:hypothetical protein
VRIAIESDQSMGGQVLQRPRQSEGLHIFSMREQSNLDYPNATRNECLLSGTSHPHRDVSISA